MTALADLLAQAADVARKEGHLWLVSRIGADMMRLDAMERAKSADVDLPKTCALDDLPYHHLVHIVAPGATVDGVQTHRPVSRLVAAEVPDAG